MSENIKHFTKTIGVVLGSFEEPCQTQILSGITQFANAYNIRLKTFVGICLDEYLQYNNSYSMISSLIHSADVDGLIMMSGAMTNLLSHEEVQNFADQFTHLPVVSIAASLKGCSNLLLDNHSGIFEIVSHLIASHSCQKIAFVGGPIGHDEAEQRLEAYKQALIKHNLPVNEELILSGNFSMDSGINAVHTLLDLKQISVDAIVCVDDTTAHGVTIELNKRQILVPGEIRVTGFDDSIDAQSCIPPLTTVKPRFFEMGIKAIQTVYDLISHQIELTNYILPTQTIIRESCGCFTGLENFMSGLNSCQLTSSMTPMDLTTEILAYLHTQLENTFTLSDPIKRSTTALIEHLMCISDIEDIVFWNTFRKLIYELIYLGVKVETVYSIITTIKNFLLERSSSDDYYKIKYMFYKAISFSSNTQINIFRSQMAKDDMENFRLRQISENLITSFDMNTVLKIIQNGLYQLEIDECYVAYLATNMDDTLTLGFAYHNHTRLSQFEGQSYPLTTFLPSQLLMNIEPNNYLIMPLLFRGQYLGYIIFKHLPINQRIFETLRSHISSGIKGALLYEKQQHTQNSLKELLLQLETKNSELKSISMKDDMTGLFNRRGFMDMAGSYFNMACTIGQDMTLFFLDLDHLKKINDTYGHHEGDTAIINLASILLSTFPSPNFVGRLSGDEFVVLAVNVNESAIEPLINSFKQNLLTFNAQHPKAYTLSASIGYAYYDPETITSFSVLIDTADKSLYTAKETRNF